MDIVWNQLRSYRYLPSISTFKTVVSEAGQAGRQAAFVSVILKNSISACLCFLAFHVVHDVR